MNIDLHLHTTRYSLDSQLDPLTLVQRAQLLGLDGIVITEHDWLWREDELDELRTAAPGLVVLSGIEVSAAEGHFLAYGVQDPFTLPRKIGVADLCREIHRQGGAVVAAHPYRWEQPFDEILRDERPELDGLELMSNNMNSYCRQRALETLRDLNVAGMGSSDAHHEEIVGCCYTQFDADIRSNADLVAAIRSRKTIPRECPGKRVA